jgi:hypothetical protein
VGAGVGANLPRRFRRVVEASLLSSVAVTPQAIIPVTCDTSDRAVIIRTRDFFSATAMDGLKSVG